MGTKETEAVPEIPPVTVNRLRRWFNLRNSIVILISMGGAGFVCHSAGSSGWMVAAFLAAGTAFLISIRRDANMQMRDIDLLESVSDSLPGMVYQCRLFPTGRCVLTYANSALSWIYEKELSEMRKDCSPIMDLVHPEDRERVQKSLTESALRLTPWKGEYRVVLPRQGVRWRFAQAQVERLVDGSTLWHGFVADVTARKEADHQLLLAQQREAEALRAARAEEQRNLEILSQLNERLREEATHDHLTGVFLRRYFDRRYPEIFNEARLKRPVTLILCDIDHFKAYNDTFGHLEGDQCLKAVARALSTQINRKGQIFVRFGGEEFVAVLPGLGPIRAGVVAEDMRRCVEALAQPAATGQHSVVTVSIGVACMEVVPGDAHCETLLHAADQALYDAKRAGRNCVRTVTLNTPPGPAQGDRRLPEPQNQSGAFSPSSR